LKTNLKTKYIDEQLLFENPNGQFWLSMKDYFIKTLSS
jgi:hypothetical protein